MTNTQGGVAHVAHLGGLLVGWLYLRSGTGRPSFHPIAEIKYRYLKWKINRGAGSSTCTRAAVPTT